MIVAPAVILASYLFSAYDYGCSGPDGIIDILITITGKARQGHKGIPFLNFSGICSDHYFSAPIRLIGQ